MIQSADAKLYDVVIIGAGVLGLWAARHAIKQGKKVIVLEKHHVGAGASGGFLGALMPHMPDNWNPKKQFQFDGLSSLPDAVAELESDTGIDCGYRRCGRLMPITNEKLRSQIGRRISGADNNWQDKFSMAIGDVCDALINSDIAKFGVQHDTISARINPRQYLKALANFVQANCDFRQGQEVINLKPEENKVVLANGDFVHAGEIVVANGFEAYPLLQPFMRKLNDEKSIGRGVKGQAVLLQYKHSDDLPIFYHDGCYIVPHANNCVAIGSTSVNDWQGQEKDSFDEADMEFYEKAIELVPALKDAPIIERWAGVRPRNTLEGRGTEPYFGSVPECQNLIALIGGFKITLGIAHIAYSSISK